MSFICSPDPYPPLPKNRVEMLLLPCVMLCILCLSGRDLCSVQGKFSKDFENLLLQKGLVTSV